MCRTYLVTKSSSASKSQHETASSASTTSTSVANAPKRQHFDELEGITSEAEDGDSGIVHQNQPVLMSVYKDPESLCEKVCVCVTLSSGVTDVKFSLLGAGPATTTAVISYIWPEIMYSVEGLFATEIKTKSVSPTHPMIMVLKLELEINRSNIEAKLRGSIELALPIPVQTDSNTVNFKAGKTADGVIILIAHLSAFPTYTKTKTVFDCKFVDF